MSTFPIARVCEVVSLNNFSHTTTTSPQSRVHTFLALTLTLTKSTFCNRIICQRLLMTTQNTTLKLGASHADDEYVKIHSPAEEPTSDQASASVCAPTQVTGVRGEL